MPENKPEPNPLEALRQRAEEANSREVETLIQQIKEARRDVEASLTKLTHLAEEMRGRARRSPETSSSLVTFATAHLRFAGAATQGMRRTASMDKFLDRAKAEKEETQRRETQERKWAEAYRARKQVERLVIPTADAFDELYGEVVNNA
jgi:flagellar biosynthesis chaperone FliJ